MISLNILSRQTEGRIQRTLETRPKAQELAQTASDQSETLEHQNKENMDYSSLNT